MAYLFRFYLLGCCSLNVFKEFSGNPSSFKDFFKGFILTLFSYQGSCRCWPASATHSVYHTFQCLSTVFLFYFSLFRFVSADSLLIIPDYQLVVNHFFQVFLKRLCAQKNNSVLRTEASGERGIWTLAPREGPTPVAGAPLRPLEYFSELRNSIWLLS